MSSSKFSINDNRKFHAECSKSTLKIRVILGTLGILVLATLIVLLCLGMFVYTEIDWISSSEVWEWIGLLLLISLEIALSTYVIKSLIKLIYINYDLKNNRSDKIEGKPYKVKAHLTLPTVRQPKVYLEGIRLYYIKDNKKLCLWLDGSYICKNGISKSKIINKLMSTNFSFIYLGKSKLILNTHFIESIINKLMK